MKKLNNLICCTVIAITLATLVGCDKEERLYGDWNLQAVLMNGDTLKDSDRYAHKLLFTTYRFFYEQRLTISTYANGQYCSSPDGMYLWLSNSELQMRFTILDQHTNIKTKIKKLTNRELNLEYVENGNTYFLKLYTQ